MVVEIMVEGVVEIVMVVIVVVELWVVVTDKSSRGYSWLTVCPLHEGTT